MRSADDIANPVAAAALVRSAKVAMAAAGRSRNGWLKSYIALTYVEEEECMSGGGRAVGIPRSTDSKDVVASRCIYVIEVQGHGIRTN